jgi:hypothetical protein
MHAPIEKDASLKDFKKYTLVERNEFPRFLQMNVYFVLNAYH